MPARSRFILPENSPWIITKRYSTGIQSESGLFPNLFEDPVVSRKTHQSRLLLLAISSFIVCLTMIGQPHLHGQEALDDSDKGLNLKTMELVAPNYQPEAPARINMALLDDTKPKMQRLTTEPDKENSCDPSTCPDCQRPSQQWKSTVAVGPFEDMVEGLTVQLSNPGMSATQKANILRSAFETVAQQTRMQARPAYEKTASHAQENRSATSLGSDAHKMQNHPHQNHQWVGNREMENVRRWLEVVYSHQAALSSQMQRMAIENAALKASVQLMQQQMKMSKMPADNQVGAMRGTTTAGSTYQPTERVERSNLDQVNRQVGSSGAVMAWSPMQGYHLKPLHPQEATPGSTRQRVIRADYQTQIDREIDSLHRQMERLTTQIEDFQARHNRLPPAPDLLEPVYAPEQELKPLESLPTNRPLPYR